MTQIGGLLDSKGYGIATPKGSPWRDQLSLAILELQEKGTIQMLYNKWWKNTGDVCTRQVSKVIIPYESPILGQLLDLISPAKINLFEPRLEFYNPYDMAN